LGCYIKLGQIICQLEHLIPTAYIRALEPLCQECQTSDFTSILRTLEREFGRPLNELFSSIESEPLGSASIAQVHKGYLLDGTPVAIKVINC
jgi:ubiquinone biosynthesis protein